MSLPQPAVVIAPSVVPVRHIRRILVAAAAVFAVLFMEGVVPRLVLRHRLRTSADAVQNRAPMVSRVSPRRAPEVVEVPLPGSMEAIVEAGIWARADGYLNARLVDRVDRVHTGAR